MTTFYIDDLQFLTLSTGSPAGPPIVPHARGLVITRPGVDHAGFIRTGTRGRSFAMRSLVDLSDSSTANAAFNAYLGKVLQAKYNIVFDGVSWASVYSTKFVVLSVEPIRRQKMTLSAGGISGSGANRYVLECEWQLFPVSAS